MPEILHPAVEPLPARTARNVLLVLTFINLFNYLDRFVVAGLTESLRESELALTDDKLGLLATGFLIVYALVSPRFGRLGDTRRRPRIIAFGVAVWSIATVAGGFARSFFTLLLARAAVGVGEAAYGTIAPSLLADCFPKSRRGRVFAIFYAAIPIGAALGYLVAAQMDKHFGWRSAFFVAGAPGLLLALMLLRLPEAPRGGQDSDEEREFAKPQGTASRGVYQGLLRNRPYVFTVLGYAAYTFALGGLSWWMPSFLERVRGMPRDAANTQIGAIVVVTGFVGTFLGGWLGDHFLKYTRNSYLLVSGVATLVAAPCAYVALSSTKHFTYLVALVAAELLLFISTGPINSAIINAVAPGERATAMAVSILAIHVLGDVPSPYIVGALSQAGGSTSASLSSAILILPVAILVGGVIWTAAGLRRSAPRPLPVG